MKGSGLKWFLPVNELMQSHVWPQGGVIGILIKWDCNLDRFMQHCLPRYSFQRLDEKESNKTLYPGLNFRWARVKGQCSEQSRFTKGTLKEGTWKWKQWTLYATYKQTTSSCFEFRVKPVQCFSVIHCVFIRYAKYNTVTGVEERTLYKAFGIRFDVMVFGQVGSRGFKWNWLLPSSNIQESDWDCLENDLIHSLTH